MKHILRSLPLGKPFCPHCLASHSSKHSLHALFTTHQIHIHGHRVAPWCVAPVRPPTLRSRPHGRPLRAARRLPARVPPIPRSLGPTALFPHSPCERQRERGTGGRGGRLLMARPPTSPSTPSHAILGRGKVGKGGWHQRQNKKANTFPPSLVPSPPSPRLFPFSSSSHLSPPSNACEARVMETVGMHAHGHTTRLAPDVAPRGFPEKMSLVSGDLIRLKTTDRYLHEPSI